MGYVRDKTYKLTWAEDSEFAGLEVRMRPGTIGTMKRIAQLPPRGGTRMSNEAAIEAIGEISELLAGSLVSWNLEVETEVNGEAIRQPVPATVDGLAEQDYELVFAIVQAWMDAQTEVPTPLAVRSSDGELSALVRSLPMEPLSESRPILSSLS